MPLPIQPARIAYEDRDLIPIRFGHALAAAVILPVVGFIAYVAARLLFSIPS
jgi:hypothetical protein